MISSLLLFGSSYKKNKVLSALCYITMLFNLLIGQFGQVNIIFLIINIGLFAILPIVINKVRNKYLNAIASIMSILIWSIIIDVICYYMFPQFVLGQNIFTYIYKGIIFNSRYVLVNSIALAIINLIEIVYIRIKKSIKEYKLNRENVIVSL